METKLKLKVGTFYMDVPKDITAYEAILNNESCRILRRESFTLNENEKTFDEGKLVASVSRQRVHYVVEYEIEDI